MGLIERIKSALGLGTSTSPSRPNAAGNDRPSPASAESASEPNPASDAESDEQLESGQTVVEADDEVDVTVEHDPEDDADAAPEPDTAAEDAVKGTDTADAATGVDLEDIKGIGPTYADRLRDAGVADVAALADEDPDDLADRADVAASRVRNWVDRARAY